MVAADVQGPELGEAANGVGQSFQLIRVQIQNNQVE